MNDKDIATLILSLEKGIIKDYSVAITEASTKKYENKIIMNSNNAITVHRDLFDLMMANNWYQLEPALETKIKSEYNKLNTTLENISN
ncbi:MAG: spore coat protein [Bacilli bacterium]